MKKKSILILLVMCSIIFITTGTFAYYRYSVNGSIVGKASNYTFNVTSNSTTTKDINLGSNLKPFDKGSFNLTVKLDNTDCDAYYTLKIEKTKLPKGFKFLSQDDNISPFSTHSKYFNASDTKTDTVTIYWYWDGNVDDEDDNSFIGKNISANIVINSKQTNPAYMKNGYSLSANGGTEFWNSNYRPYIRTINFCNDLSNLPSSCNEENLCWDISYATSQNKKVYGYLVDTGLKDSTDNTKPLYNLYIVSEAQIFAPSSSNYIFSFRKYANGKNISNLISINFNNNFNTSKVTNMESMFCACLSLTNLDLSNFNTSKVTNMEYMFYKCESLTTTINIMNANVSNYTNMFFKAATASDSKITVNYIADAYTLVDNMIATKSSNSNVIKGSIIPEYSITISGNEDIKYESNNRLKGTKVTLTSISGNYLITSFKVNGTTINGNEFIMPDNDVTISDIVTTPGAIYEINHYPYPNSQDNVIIGEHIFEGAKSLTVILDYET